MNATEDWVIGMVDTNLAPFRTAQRRARIMLAPVEALTLRALPIPPSVNGLYANVPGKGRIKSDRYKVWKNAAGWDVKAQIGSRRVAGPVNLTICICESEARGDLDNRCKATIDLLVDLNIIDGDDKRVVRRIVLEWTREPGLSVTVEPVSHETKVGCAATAAIAGAAA